MRKIALVGVLAVIFATSAQANFVLGPNGYYENFEDGLTGWSLWTERGTNTSAAALEDPDLGDPATTMDDPNDTMAIVGGNAFNGGIYTTISGLPTGTPLTIDGWWRPLNWPANNGWAEVIVIPDSTPPPPQDGSDYNVAGNLEYKTDSFNGAGPGSGDSTTFSGAEVTDDGSFTTTTGTITVILKVGNGSGLTDVAFDDVLVTPEPTAALLLALPGLALLRRRR